jgi:hypothetical protein
MTRTRDFDPDGLRQLVGACADLFGHVRRAAPVRGLGQFHHDPTTRVGHGCGELGAAEVRRKTIGRFACH